MKTLFINNLAPSYKDYVLSQEPGTLNDATNMARAMWKRKHPAGQLPKLQNMTMSPITAAIEDTLNGLPEDIREECILAIKSKRNNTFRNNQSNSHQNNNNCYIFFYVGTPKESIFLTTFYGLCFSHQITHVTNYNSFTI
jgi:hypothetical protein